MISLVEILGVSLFCMALFRLIGNGGAGVFIFGYIFLRVIWSMAGLAVERERAEKDKWEREHPGETFVAAPDLFSGRGVSRAWRGLVALARAVGRVR